MLKHIPTSETSANSFTPVLACDQQDVIFAKAFSILREAISQQAFPAASIAVTRDNQLIALKAFGRFTYEPNSPEVKTSTVFDLASVSKVVATTSMAMILYERGLLDLESPVAAIVPEFSKSSDGIDIRRKDVTLRMLLSHSSGLPAYEKLFLRSNIKQELFEAAYHTPLSALPGAHAEYSDIGFIILGVALERIANESIDRFCQREVFGPLGMAHTTFNPPLELRTSIPPTADDKTFRNRIVQGEVNDENAFVLGGVAGHAGVFSTAGDLAIFANVILNDGRPLVRPETLRLFTQKQSSPPGTSRGLGWDTPSAPSQSGKHFSAKSFGHLGYTGTSLWIDQQRKLSVTLLTNRTWPDSTNQAIKQIRPQFHDAVFEALGINSASNREDKA